MVSARAPVPGSRSIPVSTNPLLALCTELDPALPLHVIGDSQRIGQILINLLGNALKFTDAGHVRLRLLACGGDDHRVAVRFEVSDTGIGIAEDALLALFSPFHQADSSAARRFEGTMQAILATLGAVELASMLHALERGLLDDRSGEVRLSAFVHRYELLLTSLSTALEAIDPVEQTEGVADVAEAAQSGSRNE